MMAPPSNFGASQLQHEGLVGSNLHMNLVTWVPTVTKTQKKVSKFQWSLSYASCDKMIKKGLCNVGLNSCFRVENSNVNKHLTVDS